MPAQAALETVNAGIDRRQLRAVRSRFRSISSARLERVRAMLPPRHRDFLDLLPLLLHVNHPALPGYVSQATPSGITGWSPPSAVLTLAARVARSFSPAQRRAPRSQIHAVYLMGSPGTLGHSDRSDLDIWVCYPHDLEAGALALLARKTALLHDWAATLGLEAHLFLMNGEKYRSGEREPLTGENCGSTQHHLLLDEFYRTGILLAGRIPAWWLVPPEQEHDHAAWCARLLQRRYVRGNDVVDFGDVAGLSAGEFLGAGIWQLYKAIESPYKSLLKLILFEVYASELPRVRALSTDCKRMVYAGGSEIDELDPYVMIYRRIEHYLQHRGQETRLEIVRRSLYYKAGRKLSLPPHDGQGSWQRRLMERLTAEWGWDGAKLARLDARRQWNILDVEAERNELVRELRASYRFLSDFAGSEAGNGIADRQELAILGRRLHAAYERQSGKIDMLNPGREVDVSEASLTIRRAASTPTRPGGWLITSDGATDPGQGVLRRGECLAELLGWAVVNGVIGDRTRLLSSPHEDGLRDSEARAMVRELRRFIRDEPMDGNTAFGQGARITSLLVFVNIAADPLRSAHERGLQRVSSRTDSLGYSALRENLVLNLETVARTSWGELICSRYDGVEGLLRCLADHLQSSHRDSHPRLDVHCFSPSRSQAITNRIEELFADLSRHCHRERGDAARYVLEIGGRLHLLTQRNGSTRVQTADDLGALYELLGGPQPDWSPIAIDRHALPRNPLRAMLRHARPWHCSVFVESEAEGTAVTVIDGHGSVWRTAAAADRQGTLAAALMEFLDAERDSRSSATAAWTVPAWFRVERRAGSDAILHAMAPPPWMPAENPESRANGHAPAR